MQEGGRKTAPSEFAGGKGGAVAGTSNAAAAAGRAVGWMIPLHGSSHSMAVALLLAAGKTTGRGTAVAPRLHVAAPSPPSSARVLLYLPFAWLLQLVVSDLLHLFFHACTSLSTSARGWGWGLPGRVLAAVGHIHTVHHKHVDAFGTVDRQHRWASLVLDKLLKRSVIQYLSWKSWCGILRLNHLMENFMRLPRSSAPRARFAMLLLTRVELLRSAALVVQTVLHHVGDRCTRAAGNDSRHSGGIGCPIARLDDHPPLGLLPQEYAHRLAVAIGTGDPQALLQWRVFTSPIAHSLHHYHSWNFPFQVVDWRAVIMLLRGGRMEWAEIAQAADLAWGGLVELPPNSRRTERLAGSGLRPVHAASAAALAPLRCAKLRLVLAKAMSGGPESATHCLADDLHALIASRLTLRRVTAGMVRRGDIDTDKNQQAALDLAAVRRPHLSFLGALSGISTTASVPGKLNGNVSCDLTQRQPLYVVRRVLGRRRGRGNGSMELLIEWEDGEAPPPPGQRLDEDATEDPEHAIADRPGETRTAGTERSDSRNGMRDEMEPGRGYVAVATTVGQPQREEVDFQAAGGEAGVCSSAGCATQWVQKATVEVLVGREMVQDAVLAYHRKVSHIARLVASG